MLANDTIVAISTPPGRGGIGIVRLSGPQSLAICAPMLRLRNPLAHAQARFAEILDCAEVNSAELEAGMRQDAAQQQSGRKLDDAVVTWFAAPNSYTSEDLVEIAAHGSPVILDHLLRQAISLGARLAEPGEFTQRAFLAGRIDLTQAEAVRDLIDAHTLHQARIAGRQMDGALAAEIRPVKEALVALIAALEAGIDFAEDDIDVLPQDQILSRISAVREPLQTLAASFAYGRIVHDGLTLAIAGRPNVGKSSLFNRLVERDRAIVTAAPGTTRDPVAERVSIGGIPVELIDTAGLRAAIPGTEPLTEAETIGIGKSRQAIAEADLVLVVLDATRPVDDEEKALIQSLEGRPCILISNKSDLVPNRGSHSRLDAADAAASGRDIPPHSEPVSQAGFAQKTAPGATLQEVSQLDAAGFTRPKNMLAALSTSALSGEGIAELKRLILAKIENGISQSDSALLTNVRQHQAVQSAVEGLASAEQAAFNRIPHEMLLLDIYSALRSLDSLTGVTTADDILNLIFSTFCIGK